MQALPEYTDIRETRSARATETSKLMYYNTENINYWYDEMIKILCDELKIAKRCTDGTAEIVWTGNRNRILFSDETAVKDRDEAKRVAKKLLRRITRWVDGWVLKLHGWISVYFFARFQGSKLAERTAQEIRKGRALLNARDGYDGLRSGYRYITSCVDNL